MKLVKFGNTGNHRGMPIYINADHITAVFEVPSQSGGSLETHIYGGCAGQGVEWVVEEGISEVVLKLGMLKSKGCTCGND
jgi:hypothetical protein